MERRTFVKSMAAAGAGTMLSSTLPSWAIGNQQTPTQKALIIDAMAEIRLTHTRELIKEVIDSGTNVVTVTVSNPITQELEAYEDAIKGMLDYDRHIKKNSDLFVKATKVADIDKARKAGKMALFYYFQNTAQLGRNLDNVDLFYSLGMRSCQLTYNFQNWVGAGNMERTGAGLTVFGLKMVEKMNDLNILIDLSHANMKTMSDAIEMSKAPVIVTHSDCKSIFEHLRNTTDENLRKLAEHGGVFGLSQLRVFLTEKKKDNLDEYFKHIKHVINVAGIDHVCIGSDRDHRVIADTPEEIAILREEEGENVVNLVDSEFWPLYIDELNGPRRMEVVWDGLKKIGLSDKDREKVMGLNLYRLYKEVIG